jgi:thioester reductase-like protein
VSVTFITGFPGFIGRRVVARLLADDPQARVIALVEQRMLDSARAVAEGIGAERVELLVGDIADRRLGLSDEDYERVRCEVRRVHHLAAIYNLAVPLEIAQRVNVDGTGNVLDLCAAAESLERLVYISTAYVAGMRTGVVYEHELVMGQAFKNHYESTKFQAEVWAQQMLDRVPTTILRPAIVVGDSRTGETEKFDGPYYILRAIARSHRLGRALPQFGRADASFNVVPVDYVVDAIVAAGEDPATIGQTLHLVDPDPLKANELVTLLSREYAGRDPQGQIPPGLVTATLRVRSLRERLDNIPAESIAYLNHPVTYDARRAVDLLGARGLCPPRFGEYVGPMVSFFREREGDPRLAPAPVS